MKYQKDMDHEWCALPIEKVFQALDATTHGLTSHQAKTRFEKFGPNHLPHKRPTQTWLIFLRQLQSPLIYILGAAAGISLFIHEVTDATFILIVVGVNTLIGGVQEFKAERSAQALQKLIKTESNVIRDGERQRLDAALIVPGDVVWLESGDRIPADLRLITAHGLEVDESLLTGESLPVHKQAEWIGPASTPVADQQNMLFGGAMIVHGRAKGMVVNTGLETQVGKLAVDVFAATGGKTPLLLRLEKFTHTVGLVFVIAAAIIAVLGMWQWQQSLSSMFLFAVALAVSAIPEGLPVAITISLAVAAARMAKRGVIIRKLGAVEGLGSCSFIATDKTGTLTCNELTAKKICLRNHQIYEVTGEGFTPVGVIQVSDPKNAPNDKPLLDSFIRAGALCNEADLSHKNNHWHWRGDPTDIALLTLAKKHGTTRECLLDQYPQINAIPFEPEHRFAACYHVIDEETLVVAKGAPERILAMCSVEKASDINDWSESASQMAKEGYRVLALAEARLKTNIDISSVPREPTQMKFLGLVGLLDPLRQDAKEAIHKCCNAGIRVCMITGDHPVTALAIAKELQIANSEDQVMTGKQLEDLSENDLIQLITKIHVFARVAPHQKLQIVQTAQKQGLFVAVTGDGANDAPALKAANIGIAMGKMGTDVARQSCDMVISDDRFVTIVAGVEEGRVAYDNIRKVIFLLIATGAAEVIMVLLSVITGLPLPLLPTQLLWLNLVTGGIQDVALALEPQEGDVLKRQPRPARESIFNPLMTRNILFSASLMGSLAFVVFWWLLKNNFEESIARNALLLLMVLFEAVMVGICRSETQASFFLSPLKNRFLFFGTVGALAIHISFMYLPVGYQFLQIQPLPLKIWIPLAGIATAFFIIVELYKWAWAGR